MCWPDSRDDGSIYANRVDGAGNILWAVNGVPVCRAEGTSDWPEIVADGMGGVIIAWEDTRNVRWYQDIYAQRVDGDGNVLWTLDGVPVTTAVDQQVHLAAARDGRSGAIITWEDWRDGGLLAQRYRIYAQRVDSLGGLTVPTGIDTQRDLRSSFHFLFTAPSPPSGGAEFRFELSCPADVRLEIFDVVGRRVFATVLRDQPGGSSRYVFDGRDDEGHVLPSSVYFVRAVAGGTERTLKVVIVR
jgi:transposase InsO family protein